MPFRENKTSGPNIGIGLDLVDGCNLACAQCFYQKSVGHHRIMSTVQVKHIIDQAVEAQFTELYLLGGEPTMHPDLKPLLEYADGKFKVIIIVTNGVKFASEKYCQSIALPGVGISMHRWAIQDTPENSKIVDDLAQMPGTFRRSQKAWANIGRLWPKENMVCVQLNVLKPLIDSGLAFEVFKWARSQGYEPIIELTKPGPIFERGHRLDVSPAEVLAFYEQLRAYDEQYYPHLASKVHTPPSYGHNCTMTETGLHVTISGEVIPCVGQPVIILGNIFTQPLTEIIQHPLREMIRDHQTWLIGPCRDCEHFDYCHSGCRGEAFWDTGCPRASDPYCWHQKPFQNLHEMIQTACPTCPLKGTPNCNTIPELG
jgi:radical SAM protein with 4Fe4S-binding SPASM domain